MRILVVEDEKHLLKNLGDLLGQAGYACDLAGGGEDGLHCALEYPLDLAIVDLGLPEINGVELIRKVRAADKAYPILILTARDDWQDKVEGLEAGADDYLTKPFNNEELLARVNALIRRSKGFSAPTISLGQLTLDTASKTLSVGQIAVQTTAYEYRLLECLMLNAGCVMSKTELVEHIYAEEADRDSNVIEVFIGRLRKKIAKAGVSEYIETVRGQGYRIASE